jgi:hypothetical protein
LVALFNDKHDVELDTIEVYLKDFLIAFVKTSELISLVKTLPIKMASNEIFRCSKEKNHISALQ